MTVQPRPRSHFRVPALAGVPPRAWPGCVLAGFFLAGCGLSGSVGQEPAAPVAVTDTRAPMREEGRDWAERTLAGLTLREKAGQMMMAWVAGDFAPVGSEGQQRLRQLVEDRKIGGVVMSVGTPTEVAVKLNSLQAAAAVPLLVGADLEAGAGFRLRGAVHVPTGLELGGATEFPPHMALGATGEPALAYETGRITALEARAVGIHVPFAPVLDVNNNPDNPIINVRSFGEDPELVALMGAEFVRGVQESGAIATGKHFPGHGDTGVDTHLALPVIDVTETRLDSVELVPFRAAVAAGIGGIMTAHVSVPALSGEPVPATLSPAVMTGLLRERMEFDGLLFTDAMEMGAIVDGYGAAEAAVRAVDAGADVILMPPDVEAAVEAIIGAVSAGRLSEERIDTSVLRILRAKQSVGLHTGSVVDAERVSALVGIPEHVEVARRVAERSVVLIRDERRLLPLDGASEVPVLSLTFRRPNDLLAGRYFNDVVRESYPRLVRRAVDRDTSLAAWDALRRRARESELVLVSVYVTGRDRGAVSDELREFIGELARSDVAHVVTVFGNPYVLSDLPDARAYLLAWSGAEVSQRAAAAALFGRIPLTGRMPTRVPPEFERGAGIQLPARAEACCQR